MNEFYRFFFFIKSKASLLDGISAIRQLINDKADGPQILRQARKEGMMTLRECAIRRMLDGATTFNEVLRVTVDALD